MQEFEKLGVFYLGRRWDLDAGQAEADLVLYKSNDLLTHAVCVGMTGSGKTGLCVTLLEEASHGNESGTGCLTYAALLYCLLPAAFCLLLLHVE